MVAAASTGPSKDKPVVPPPPQVRGARERLVQTLWFEALGLAIVSPLFAYVAGRSAGESLVVLAVLSSAVMVWSALYNTLFDHVEARCAGRVASDRPQALRVLHAVGLEATALIVTWPLIWALTPMSWMQALVADIGLTVAYALYAYVFHRVFDRLRPVGASPRWPHA